MLFVQNDVEDIFAGQLARFSDRSCDFVGFSQPNAYISLTIPDDDQGTETEIPSTFRHLATALDRDDLFLEFSLNGLLGIDTCMLFMVHLMVWFDSKIAILVSGPCQR